MDAKNKANFAQYWNEREPDWDTCWKCGKLAEGRLISQIDNEVYFYCRDHDPELDELLSDCCGAPARYSIEDRAGICDECGEHATFLYEHELD